MIEVPTWSGQEAKALRRALRLSVRGFAEHLGVAVRTVSKWEAAGRGLHPRPDIQAVLDTALEKADEQTRARFARLLRDDDAAEPPAGNDFRMLVTRGPVPGTRPSPASLDQVEQLRQDVTASMSESALPAASLDDWDQVVFRHGTATRDRPAGVLLSDLTVDLAELHRVLAATRSASSLRHLTRTTAQMAGLMCLTLIKLDERAAFRRWARTARLAAGEAGDPWTHAWVLAQEAYGHYYSRDLTEAIEVARHAQRVAGTAPGVGAVLAAALEGRVQAALGREQQTIAALRRAEDVMSRLEPEALVASAFGYNEAQLRFHEENALTQLGLTGRAWNAQEAALELCPPYDYMDRALTSLDRASCLVADGHISDAMRYATQTLTSLSERKREGIIMMRGREVVAVVPERERAAPAVQDFRELLVSLEEAPSA